MKSRRIILAVVALADVVARLVLGLPSAFAVLGMVAMISIPMCLAFMVADAVPWRRDQFIASTVGLIGLPMALLVPQWGWLGAIAVILAQALAWGRQQAGAGRPAPA